MWMKAIPADLAPGGSASVVLAGQRILIVRSNDSWHALIDRCPHQEQTMAGGEVCEHRLECPWHSVAVDLLTGRVVNDMGFIGLEPVRVLLCECRAGQVWVDVPAAG